MCACQPVNLSSCDIYNLINICIPNELDEVDAGVRRAAPPVQAWAGHRPAGPGPAAGRSARHGPAAGPADQLRAATDAAAATGTPPDGWVQVDRCLADAGRRRPGRAAERRAVPPPGRLGRPPVAGQRRRLGHALSTAAEQSATKSSPWGVPVADGSETMPTWMRHRWAVTCAPPGMTCPATRSPRRRPPAASPPRSCQPPSDASESQSLLERAQQYADQIQADAEAEAKAMRLQAARALDEARRRNALAESLLGDAQEEAKQLISDAAEQAHLVSEATNRSAQELSTRVEQDAQSIRELAQQDADRIRERPRPSWSRPGPAPRSCWPRRPNGPSSGSPTPLRRPTRTCSSAARRLEQHIADAGEPGRPGDPAGAGRGRSDHRRGPGPSQRGPGHGRRRAQPGRPARRGHRQPGPGRRRARDGDRRGARPLDHPDHGLLARPRPRPRPPGPGRPAMPRPPRCCASDGPGSRP